MIYDLFWSFLLCPCPPFALSIIFIFKSATRLRMPTDLGDKDKDAVNLHTHTHTSFTWCHCSNKHYSFLPNPLNMMRSSREINKRKMLTNHPHTITLSPHSLLAAPRCRILRGWLWICHPHTKRQGRQLLAHAVAVAAVWLTGSSLRRRLDVSIRLKQMWPFINMRSISVYPQQDGFDIILLYLSRSLDPFFSLSLPLSPSLFFFLCYAMQSEAHEISLNTTCAAEPNLWATFVLITIPLEELLNAIWIIALISELCPWVSTTPFPRARKTKTISIVWLAKKSPMYYFRSGYSITINQKGLVWN